MTPYLLAAPSKAAHYLLEGRALICLIRHGQTDWNLARRLQGREDIPLNGEGLAQSAMLASYFARAKAMGLNVEAVCSSPLSRSLDTAKAVAKKVGVTPVVCDSLIERDYGKLSGLTVEERRKKFPRGEKQAGDVESVPHAAARMVNACDEMLEISGRRTVVGVSHGGMINAVFSRLSAGEIGTGKTLTQNCSVSFIAAGIGLPLPLAYNMQGNGIVDYIASLLRYGVDI